MTVATASVVVLGTAQDGGIPHAGCSCPTCADAEQDPSRRRRVASIAVVGETGRVFVVDATPDFVAQMGDLSRRLARPQPALDALLLTHAHMGHYLGLAFLGREAMNVEGLPLYGTPRMARFLEANRPWGWLVERGQVSLERLTVGESFDFDGLAVTPFASPHRGEDTDTIGVEVRSARRSVVYLPDADRFPDEIVARIEGADAAFVDGTFYDATEIPGRDLSEIPHPFVSESVVRLSGARRTVYFTHLNHTNRLLDPDPSRRPLLPPGFTVLEDGAVFDL